MNSKLYCGNLAYSIDSKQLEEMFSEFGQVNSAEVIQDRETGRSKGFGFVEMSSRDDAMAAAEALNDQELDGRRLTVNEAKPRENNRSRNQGGYGGRSQSNRW